jgi:hypothetical protein
MHSSLRANFFSCGLSTCSPDCTATRGDGRFEDPGQSWNKLDSSNRMASDGWKISQPAPLGFGDSPATALAQEAVAYFFRKVVSLPALECFDNFTISFQRDDGAVIFVNGDEVGRSNMLAGPVNFITEAATGLNNADESEVISLTVNTSAGYLREGANVIGASVHQVRTPCVISLVS